MHNDLSSLKQFLLYCIYCININIYFLEICFRWCFLMSQPSKSSWSTMINNHLKSQDFLMSQPSKSSIRVKIVRRRAGEEFKPECRRKSLKFSYAIMLGWGGGRGLYRCMMHGNRIKMST